MRNYTLKFNFKKQSYVLQYLPIVKSFLTCLLLVTIFSMVVEWITQLFELENFRISFIFINIASMSFAINLAATRPNLINTIALVLFSHLIFAIGTFLLGYLLPTTSTWVYYIVNSAFVAFCITSCTHYLYGLSLKLFTMLLAFLGMLSAYFLILDNNFLSLDSSFSLILKLTLFNLLILLPQTIGLNLKLQQEELDV